MAHNPSNVESKLEAATVDPGRLDLGTDPKEIYRNLGLEISSLPLTAKCDRVRDFLRRNANGHVDMKALADQIGIVSSRTLYNWMNEILKSAQVQPLFPAVAAQGMAPNAVVHNAAHPSLMLGHARQPQTGSVSSYAVRARPPPTVHRWRDFRQNKSMKDGIHRNVMSAAARQAAASLAPPSRPYAGPYNPVP
jgi:hypothetical protein